MEARISTSEPSGAAHEAETDSHEDNLLEDDEDDDFLTEEEYAEEAERLAIEYAQRLESEDALQEDADDAEDRGEDSKKEEVKKGAKRRRGKRQIEWQVPDDQLPRVAIVGRPNVGKSALFNRIAGGDVAIVHDEPGVTRDRLYTRGYWGENEFMLVDTGGVVTVPSSENVGSDAVAVTSGGGQLGLAKAAQEAAKAGLPTMIEKQAAQAVAGAHAIIFVVDGKEGATTADEDIANWLRREHSSKPIILAVNKCESPSKGLIQASEFWSLGMEPVAVSAISGTGTGELLDRLVEGLPFKIWDDQEEQDKGRPLGIAIVGRPNVGKSSILNALVGEERTIVSPISGTTRDAIDTEFRGRDGQLYRLVDTAGIRKRTRVAAAGSKAEALSVSRAFRAIRRTDVVALVLQALDGVVEQDFRLADRINVEGKACVIVVNKWDTVPDKENNTVKVWEEAVRSHLPVVDWAPVIFISAATGQRVPRLLGAAKSAGEEHARRISTATLNSVIQEAYNFKPPSRGSRGGKRGRIYYCTQAAIRPPTFVFFVNDAELFDDSYKRYMERQIRNNIGFPGTPIRLLWRSKVRRERPNQAAAAARNRSAR